MAGIAGISTKVYHGRVNKVVLDVTDNALNNDSAAMVTYSLVDDLGEAVLDDTDTAITDRAAVFNATLGKWEAQFTPADAQRLGYYFIHWTAWQFQNGDPQDIVDYFELPLSVYEVRLDGPAFYAERIISREWFIHRFLARFAQLARNPEEAVVWQNLIEAVESNMLISPEVLDTYLQAARREIEESLKGFSFTLKDEVVHSHFDFKNRIRGYWTPESIQVQVNRMPIQTVRTIKFQYGQIDVLSLPTDEYIRVPSQKSRSILLHPLIFGKATAMNETAYTGAFLLTGALSGVFGAGAMFSNPSGFVPSSLEIDLTWGLDWANLDEGARDAIRMAIGRVAAMRLLPITDETVGIQSSSYSSARDGVSQSVSVSYNGSAMYGAYSSTINDLEKGHKAFMEDFKRNWGLNVEFTAV